jgi:hypothetical protein
MADQLRFSEFFAFYTRFKGEAIDSAQDVDVGANPTCG